MHVAAASTGGPQQAGGQALHHFPPVPQLHGHLVQPQIVVDGQEELAAPQLVKDGWGADVITGAREGRQRADTVHVVDVMQHAKLAQVQSLRMF